MHLFDRRKKLLERLIRDDPRFHSHAGELTSWAPHPETLRFLYRLLRPGMSTLETGCGQTTVVFAIAGTDHLTLLTDAGEAERVQGYCRELGLPARVRYMVESSDRALARQDGSIPERLDHVFIDGAHGFPAPIIDWHYTARRLRIGGTLGIDDCRMPSVEVLVQYLKKERDWEFVVNVRNAVFFRKLREPTDIADWRAQAINDGFPGY